MKTTFDVTNRVYNLINVPVITALLDGGIYKDQRPDNSDKRDIVITTNIIDNEPFQNAVGYINIHHPGDKPDHIFFSNIVNVMKGIISKTYILNTGHILISNITSPLKNDGESGFFVSIRLKSTWYLNN